MTIKEHHPDRIDAATLPKFTNDIRCARCDRLWG
jgi:hypothetical protein